MAAARVGDHEVHSRALWNSQLGELDMNVKEQLLEIVKTLPGLTDVELHRELAVRTWAAQRLGRWAAMFGPTYGAMYVALQQLARDGLVHTNRGEVAAEERKRRRAPLRFYPRQPAPSLSEQTADREAEAHPQS
jgi:hypothetical protein